jgi:type II secretory pathway component PulC
MELSSFKLAPLMATLGAAVLAISVGINNLAEIKALQQPAQTTPQGATGQPAPLSGGSNLHKLAEWHLFGRADQAQPAAPTPVIKHTEAPKTRLQLSLQGIFSPSVEGTEGWAIIEAPQVGQKAYRVGDEVPGGAILSAVETTQVILTRNNRPESLPLEKPTDSGVEMDSDLDLALDESMLLDPMLEAPMSEEPVLEEANEINPTSARARAQAGQTPPPQSRPRARAQVIDPDAAPPAIEPGEETIPKSPAMEAAEQGLVEEMERLRSRFPKQ